MKLFHKPDSVDKISPMNEIWDELKDKKLSVAIVLLVDIILSIYVSGFLYYLFNKFLVLVRANVRRFIPTMGNLFKAGITKTWWASLICFFLFLYFAFWIYRSLRKTYQKNYDDNYLKSKKETYGGAHFQTQEELEENFHIYNDIEDTEEEIFGTDDDGNIYCLDWKPGLNKNELYYGSPGCGKSAAIVKNQIYQGIRRGISLIVTDTKGDLYKETCAVAKECGYIVKILNLKPKELRNSDGFDLFHSLDPESDSLDIQADVMTNIIFNNTTGLKEIEDYWHKNEYNLVKMTIMILVTESSYIKSGKNKLPEIYNFITHNTPKSLAAMMAGVDKNSVIYKCYATFAEAKEEVQGQILNGAAIRLQKFANPILAASLSSNEMDTILPMKKKCIYYVVIPDQDNTFRVISQLFFTRIFMDQCDYSDSLTRAEKKAQLPVKYVLDEYKNTGGIIGLPEKISTVRSRKIEMVIILQDCNQLMSMYDEHDAKTIKNCCVVKAMLATNDFDTAKEFSDLLGTQTVIVENLRYMESSADVVHAQNMIQKTLGEGNRALVLPEEFMNGKIGRDEIIYAINGMPPARLKKYFAETGGKPIHPMEAWGMELGEFKTSEHKPNWLIDLEEAARVEKEKEQDVEDNFVEIDGQAVDTTTGEIMDNDETGTELKNNTSSWEPASSTPSAPLSSPTTADDKETDDYDPLDDFGVI